MELTEIEVALANPNFQYRLKAISALKAYDPEIAVPILIATLKDPEFLVRSFVARGLGTQRIATSFAALLEMTKFDDTPNVRAEAANSLSLFGKVSISHLVLVFCQDEHWLVRRSILAALEELDCPEQLIEVCTAALDGEDLTVREAAIDSLGSLVGSSHHQAILVQLLSQARSTSPRVRTRVAYALQKFDEPQAQSALIELRQDSDCQVVAASLENLFNH
ncbi:HEAT repeat domain-containing protein [Chamaesiphon sp.]|uniref:HEAT repeat domain-containing protein n=1 Tax=Chamaesiphon sp. TaxID=2814140 RepID=UPI003592EA4C